jgi:tetratricopeptide (TPR) repeat protein
MPDKKSPSGWRFRSSYHAAITDYQKALTLVPSSHLAFKGAAFDRLTRMLFTELNMFRAGESGPSDTVGFAAFVGLAGDTVSFIPYPRSQLNQFQNPMVPATATAAVLRNRAILRKVTTSWASSFPQSADALEADGIALEKLGEISGSAMADSARFRFQRARQVSRDTADRARLGAAEVRLLVKSGRFAEAKRLSDSLLGADGGSIEESEYYAGLAALTGRAARAATLNRRAAPRYVLPVPLARKAIMPLPLRETALGLEAFSALGGPSDSVRSLLARFDRESRAFLGGSERAAVDGLVLPRIYAMMYPTPESRPGRPFAEEDDYLLAMQSHMWDGDTAEVRRRFRQLADTRRLLSPGSMTPEVSFAEAQIELQLGDTVGAMDRLDGLLESLPTLGVDVLAQLPQAGALVRAMVLRARLAAGRGDDATARRWALPAATLWASADAVFRKDVTEMRRLAGYH